MATLEESQAAYDQHRAMLDVGPPPEVASIPPELIAMMASGSPGGQYDQLQKQIAAANELRQLQIPQGRSAGGVYQAANPLEFLGALMQSSRGRSEFSDLNEQASALRAESGGLDPAAFAKAQIAQLNRDASGEQRQYSNKLARARLTQSLGKLTNEEPRINPMTSLPEQVGYNEFGAAAVANPGTLINTDEWKKPEPKALSYMEALKKRALSTRLRNDSFQTYEGMRVMGQLHELGENLSQADKDAIDNQLPLLVSKTFLPQNFQEFVKNNEAVLGSLSPAARTYLERLADFVSKARNNLFGAALTKNETGLFEAFSPSADGISFADRQRRLLDTMSVGMNQLDTIRDLTRVDAREYIPNFREPQSLLQTTGVQSGTPGTVNLGPQPPVGGSGQSTQQQLQQGINAVGQTVGQVLQTVTPALQKGSDMAYDLLVENVGEARAEKLRAMSDAGITRKDLEARGIPKEFIDAFVSYQDSQ